MSLAITGEATDGIYIDVFWQFHPQDEKINLAVVPDAMEREVITERYLFSVADVIKD